MGRLVPFGDDTARIGYSAALEVEVGGCTEITNISVVRASGREYCHVM